MLSLLNRSINCVGCDSVKIPFFVGVCMWQWLVICGIISYFYHILWLHFYVLFFFNIMLIWLLTFRKLQAVNSPSLDYSHFVSLPLAFHPKLVEKLHNFQKCVLKEVNMDADGPNLQPSTSSGAAPGMTRFDLLFSNLLGLLTSNFIYAVSW